MPPTVTPTITTRSVSHDETNKRGRTKKEITDEDGQIQQTKKKHRQQVANGVYIQKNQCY